MLARIYDLGVAGDGHTGRSNKNSNSGNNNNKRRRIWMAFFS